MEPLLQEQSQKKGGVMRHSVKSARLAANAVMLTAFFASAQGPGPHGRMRVYNPATETTIKGTVQEVKAGARGQMMMMGTHLIVKTGETATEVMLGPSRFLADEGFAFSKGDSVEITGSKVVMHGTEYLIAREVVKDGKMLTLRHKDGRPEWSRRKNEAVPKHGGF
jgi:hypothetical protein